MVDRAEVAATAWAKSSFEDRRHALRTILKYILKNQETIARVAVSVVKCVVWYWQVVWPPTYSSLPPCATSRCASRARPWSTR